MRRLAGPIRVKMKFDANWLFALFIYLFICGPTGRRGGAVYVCVRERGRWIRVGGGGRLLLSKMKSHKLQTKIILVESFAR